MRGETEAMALECLHGIACVESPKQPEHLLGNLCHLYTWRAPVPREVFVSFDYDNDKRYKYLLEAWHANPRFTFVFADVSSSEIDSNNVGRVKAALTTKIRAAAYTLVIVGRYANVPDARRGLIGYRNWINFEVAQSKLTGNRLVAVKLDRTFESPEQLLGARASWAMSFTESAILRALDEA